MAGDSHNLGVEPPMITVSRPTSELFMSAPPRTTTAQDDHSGNEIGTPDSLNSGRMAQHNDRHATMGSNTLNEAHDTPNGLKNEQTFSLTERSRTSSTSTLPPPKPTKSKLITQNIIAWQLELVWAFISIALVMALVMILSHYNNQPLPDLPLGLTLNTIIAVLATLCRATTVFLVSQGIGQLKWNLFAERGRPVGDLRVFDEASRGPWGGLVMIGRTRGSILPILASVLVITSLGSSTLTQSAISYVPRLVAANNLTASTRTCNEYPCGGPREGWSMGNVVDSTKFLGRLESAAFGSVFGAMDGNPAPLEPECQSADCEYPDFNTLGICYQMKNITDMLELNSTDPDDLPFTALAKLPMGGAILNETTTIDTRNEKIDSMNITTLAFDVEGAIASGGFSSITWPNERKSLAFADKPNLLLAGITQFLIIYNNVQVPRDDPARRYRAVEVILHFCSQRVGVKVDQGTARTKILGSYTNVTNVDEGTVTINGDGRSPSFTMVSEDGKQKYKLTSSAQPQQLGINFDRAFRGFWSPKEDQLEAFDNGSGEIARHVGSNIYANLRPVDAQISWEEAESKIWKNLNHMMNVITTSMSNSMREVGAEVQGTAYSSVTFIKIRWEWLTMVAAQVGLSIVFMLAVMIGTAKAGVDVVKSDNLAELFAVKGAEDGVRVNQVTEDEDFGTRRGNIKPVISKEIQARLLRDEYGWHLVVNRKASWEV